MQTDALLDYGLGATRKLGEAIGHIEDESILRQTIDNALELGGVDVKTAPSGVIANAIVKHAGRAERIARGDEPTPPIATKRSEPGRVRAMTALPDHW